MVEKIYEYRKKQKILKKYAFPAPLSATKPLSSSVVQAIVKVS